MGKKGSKNWKNVERRVATYLDPDGRRNPLSGSNSGHRTRSDALTKYRIYVEVKHGKNANATLRSRKLMSRLFVDTETKALAEGKIPVLVLHPDSWPGGMENYPAFVRVPIFASWDEQPLNVLQIEQGMIVQIPLSAVKDALPTVSATPRVAP